MGTKIETYRAIMECWRRKDVEGVLARLTEDVVWHFAAAIDPPLRGREEARQWLQRYASGMADSRWRVITFAETATQLFVEGVEDFETSAGTRVQVPYAGVCDFSGNRISGWRDYFDRGLTLRLRAGEAPAEHVRLLTQRPAAITTG